jgi:transcriptional regulator with XRE-family HTH domain
MMLPMVEERKYAKALGRTIKALRGTRTQRQIAEAAGLPISTLSKIEQARQIPRNETFGKIARGLGLSVSELEQRVVERTLGAIARAGAGGEDEEAPETAAPATRRAAHPDEVDLAGLPRAAALRIRSTFGTIDALRHQLDSLDHDVRSLVREFQALRPDS